MSNLSTCNAMKRIQCDNGSLKYAVYLKFAIDVISITECKLKLQLSSLKTFLLNLKMMVVHTEISKLRFSNEIVFQNWAILGPVPLFSFFQGMQFIF